MISKDMVDIQKGAMCLNVLIEQNVIFLKNEFSEKTRGIWFMNYKKNLENLLTISVPPWNLHQLKHRFNLLKKVFENIRDNIQKENQNSKFEN